VQGRRRRSQSRYKAITTVSDQITEKPEVEVPATEQPSEPLSAEDAAAEAHITAHPNGCYEVHTHRSHHLNPETFTVDLEMQ
jgi:hypothetical protein